MPGPARQRRTTRPRSVMLLLAATVGLVVTTVSPAGAAVDVIVLPGASSAEGIAKGEGDTFYAGYFRDLDGNKLCAFWTPQN